VALGPSNPRRFAADLWQLTKPRIAIMVLVTTAAGFLLDARLPFAWPLFLETLAGTGLLACGAGALNQWLERELDQRMERTRDRPLPANRVAESVALWLGVTVSVAGLAWLTLRVGSLPAMFGGLTLVGYLALYTPLKRITSLATIVGAFPGAVPPLMGWTAAHGELGAGAWALFGILFLWQLPHFLAIAWMYRDDYRRGGFPILTTTDATGQRTGRQALLYCAALVPVSLLPSALNLTGKVYLFGCLAVGVVFLGYCVAFATDRTRPAARRLLLASVAYLPAVLALLLADRVTR